MRSVGFLVAVVAVGSGCTRTWERETTQPNPLVHPQETLRISEKITIVTSDMDLDAPDAPETNVNSMNASPVHNHHWPLLNQAYFTMVSRDRLRFHVQIDHKWEEYADLNNWNVTLTDDKGRHWDPESIEHVRRHIITTMWDREQRSQICDSSGRNARGDCFNPIGFANDGWKRPQTLGTLSVYRGNGDFVFYQRDLFTRDIRWMKLSVTHGSQDFEFLWKFQDDVASVDE